MKLAPLLLVAGFVFPSQGSPLGAKLQRRWDSDCLPQNLGPGTWYRVLVKNFYRFAGSEENQEVTGCWFPSQFLAEDDVRSTCRLHTSGTSSGCYWEQRYFQTQYIAAPPTRPT